MEETGGKQVSKETQQQAFVQFRISNGSKGRSENWINFRYIQKVEPFKFY